MLLLFLYFFFSYNREKRKKYKLVFFFFADQTVINNNNRWRSIAINDIRDKSSHFIDGDLIESFLDLTPQQMRGVVEGQNGGRKLDYTVERLCQVVEELMSIHS